MMIVMMALPILGLLLFYWFSFRIALPLYLFLFFVSALMYYGMFTVMGRKRRVRTGFEEMIGKDAVVFEDINPDFPPPERATAEEGRPSGCAAVVCRHPSPCSCTGHPGEGA